MTDDLHEPARQLIAARTEEDVLHAAVSALSHLTGADRCDVALPKGDGLQSRANVTFGRADGSLASPVDAHRSIVEHAFDVGTAGLVDDLADVRSAAEETAATDVEFRSLLCVPVGGEGVFVAADRQPGAFSGCDLEAVTRLAGLVASGLERCSHGGPDDPTREEAVANVISHDVQNAIAVANARLELAVDEYGADEHLRAVDAAHERLLDMTSDLVTVLRTGDSVHAIEPVEFDEEVRRAWRAVGESTATLEIADSAAVMADRSSLCQLLENLLRNAVDHAGDDAAVTVGVRTDPPGFYVADDGPGVPADERDAVFDMGYSTGDSTGYGLAIVERIAAAHGWDVSVTEGSDGGARFEVTGVEFASE